MLERTLPMMGRNRPMSRSSDKSSSAGLLTYGPTPGNTTLNATSIQNSSGGQPHSNFQPYLCLSFIISLFGIFPSQS